MIFKIKKTTFLILFTLMMQTIFAQNYVLVERTDLRRYDNGKYVGLLSREIKSFIIPTKKDDEYFYDGYFYVNQKTKRNNYEINSGIKDAILSSFKIDNENNFTMITDNGYPSFRGFPVLPLDLKIGDIWQATSVRSVDPLENNQNTKMPILVEYEYLKDSVYNQKEVYVIKAKWATRYGGFSKIIDEDGDKNLISANGQNDANIYVDKNTLQVLLIHDTVNEIFNYSDKKIEFKGTISIFTENPPAVNKEEIIQQTALIEDEEIDYEHTQAGYKFTLSDLKFVADSDELIEGEEKRLDKIAEILLKVPDSMILIEGHTASTGNVKGEMELSLKRTHTIVNELVKRGLKIDNFICKGWGGTKPIADNDTPEGKAKNRRVEITILE